MIMLINTSVDNSPVILMSALRLMNMRPTNSTTLIIIIHQHHHLLTDRKKEEVLNSDVYIFLRITVSGITAAFKGGFAELFFVPKGVYSEI